MSAGRMLIRGGWVLSMDDAIGTLPAGDVRVEDGLIVEVGVGLSDEGATVVDASDRIVLPGFVDTHKHTWQSTIRHRCGNMDIDTYFGEMFAYRGPRYRPEDVHVGNLLGALTALDGGTTTLLDWSHIQNSPEHTDAAVDGLREAGIRAVFAHGWPMADIPHWIADSTRPHPSDIRRLRDTAFAADSGLLHLAMAARGPELATMDVTRHDLELARELGIRTTIHMGCGARGAQARAIERMGEAGLLGPDLTFVHCSRSSDDELRRMADHGVSASVGPQAEQTMGNIGDFALDRLRRFGVLTGLSSDTETSSAGDMLTQLRYALSGERSIVNNGHSSVTEPLSDLTTEQVLRMGTIDGAHVVGLDHVTGSLTPGKSADLILVRADAVNLAPVTDPVSAVVLAAHPGNVDAVLVAGEFRKRDGKLLVDLAPIAARARESRDHLLAD